MTSPANVVSTGMTTTSTSETEITRESADGARLRRRLFPLYLAAALAGLSLWVPVEKLLLKQIGFDAAGIGIMAYAYAGCRAVPSRSQGQASSPIDGAAAAS